MILVVHGESFLGVCRAQRVTDEALVKFRANVRKLEVLVGTGLIDHDEYVFIKCCLLAIRECFCIAKLGFLIARAPFYICLRRCT